MPNQVSSFNSVSKNLRGFLKPLENPLPVPLSVSHYAIMLKILLIT